MRCPRCQADNRDGARSVASAARLMDDNRVLRAQLKGHRLRLKDDQRRRLAAKGHRLGRRLLSRVATIVTPDTITPRAWCRAAPDKRWMLCDY
jgi:hypothetical protein